MSTGIAEKIVSGLKTEKEILDAGWAIMKAESGTKTARYYFCYNEDFPSDLLSEYNWLEQQRNTTQVVDTQS